MKKEGKEGNEEEGLYLYNRDEQGSTSSIIDSEGKAAAVYDYDEYGNTEVLSGDSFGNELCYTGQVRDKSTGLYYYNARFYDSSVGSFTSQDSYRGEYNNPLTQNLYTYCAGDPVNRVDPTGHSWLGDKWKKIKKYVKKNKYVKKAVKIAKKVYKRYAPPSVKMAVKHTTTLYKKTKQKVIKSQKAKKKKSLKRRRPTKLKGLAISTGANVLKSYAEMTPTGKMLRTPWSKESACVSYVLKAGREGKNLTYTSTSYISAGFLLGGIV